MTADRLKDRELLERAAAILGSQGFAAWDSLAEDIRTHLATPPQLPDAGGEAVLAQTADQLLGECKLMQAGWEDANQRLEYERRLNARLRHQIDSLRVAQGEEPAPQPEKIEPWQHVDSGDLDNAEQFVINRAGRSFMLPRDETTLANICLHCIREVRASRAEIARLKEAMQAGLDRWIPVNEERPKPGEQDVVCYTGDGFAVAMPGDDGAWFDRRSHRVYPSHFIRLSPPAGAADAEKQALPQERSTTIEKDLFGTIHIKLGDFDFIQIQYQYPYTDNASQNRIARRIQEMLDPFTLTEVERLTAERDQFRELARANARALGDALRERDGAKP